jgi:octaprenyl-diphosphate synthase
METPTLKNKPAKSSILKTSPKVFDPRDFPSYLPKLNNLYDDLFTGGKGFRSHLVQMICERKELDPKAVPLLCQTVEFIHNASLLHDDLVDRSALRRGKTTAWMRYTPEYAVLAGDYLLARVMVNLSGFGNIRLVQYTSEVISDLLEGEWLQDSLVGDVHIELSQLDRVHNLKTASLFKWCLRAPFLAEENYDHQIHTHLEEMGTLLGQLFQRSDDLLDYDVRNFENKAILGDLKTGYFNSATCFLTKALSAEEKNRFKAIKSIEDVHQFLGGKKTFEQEIEKFDQMNLFLIKLYQHHLKSVGKLLKPSELGLEKSLAELPELLYWRKSK